MIRDNNLITEGSFSWLSAVKGRPGVHQREETTTLITGGIDAQKVIEQEIGLLKAIEHEADLLKEAELLKVIEQNNGVPKFKHVEKITNLRELRDWLDPVCDNFPDDKRPKVRGVFMSLIIATVIWVFMANVLTVFLLSLWMTALLLANGPTGFIDKVIHYIDWKMASGSTFGFAMYVESLSHGTAYIAYLCARHWSSITRVILFPMIGRRYYSGASYSSRRINRINIMGY